MGSRPGSAQAAPGQRASPVVSDSASRFAARVRARRRRRLASGAGVVGALVLLAWVLLWAPWARVSQVQVTGVVLTDTSAARAAGETQRGRPLLLADTAGVERSIVRQKLVLSVQVSRSWPGKLSIRIVERKAVAAIPAGERWRLVDPEMVEVSTVSRAPVDVPIVQVPLDARPGTVQACLTVLGELPTSLAGSVVSVGATSPDGVWFTLPEDRTVRWGSAAHGARKADVLIGLMKSPARTYDVTAPDAPALTQ